MMWKIADIGNEIFHDFFGTEDLNGKIIYFIEGEIEAKSKKTEKLLRDINIKSNINPGKLTISFIDDNNILQKLMVPLLGVLTPCEYDGVLAMKGESLTRFVRSMPEYGNIEIYAGTNEGYVLSLSCCDEKTGAICCRSYDVMDAQNKTEIKHLLHLKNKDGQYLDLSEYPSRRVRLLAINDRRRYDSPEFVSRLLKLLDDEDSLIRIRASIILAREIKQIPDRDTILSLLKRHENESSKRIKRNLDDAIRSVLDLLVKSADVDTLVYLFKNAPKKQKELFGVHLSLIKGGKKSEEVLGLLKGDDIINSFFAAQYIVNSHSTDPWQQVLDILHKFDDYQRKRITTDMYQNNPEFTFHILVENLKKCDDDKKPVFIQAFRIIGLPKAFPTIAGYIESNITGIRCAVIEAITSMQYERGKGDFLIPKLNKIIENDKSSKIREAAIKAVLSLKSDKSHDTIKKATSDKDHYVRLAAVEALAELGNPGDVGEIADCLNDPSPKIRISALSTLWKIYERYRKIDIDMYMDLDEDSEFGNEISKKLNPHLPYILGLLGDEDWSVSNKAVVIIRKWPAVFIINGLIESMRAEVKPEIQNNAIRILGEMYGPYSENENSIGDVTEYLIVGLSNDDPSIRNGCAQALGKRRDPCAAEELESLFMKPDECDQVKKTALWAYNNIMDYYNH